MSVDVSNNVKSGFAEYRLPPRIKVLRDKALDRQRHEWQWIPTLPIIDAKSWLEHTPEEPWRVWRARLVANRLRQMPIDIREGELVVGRPLFRGQTAEEIGETEQLRGVIDSMPPGPGGDLGHFNPDWEKVLTIGIGGIGEEIRTRKAGADDERKTFYSACEIALEAASDYCLRVADQCELLAAGAADSAARGWLEMSRTCRKVATEPPETFHEAVQLMFLMTVALWCGEGHYLTNPGRIDQTLRRFYEADLASGRSTREDALQILCCLYIQYNMILGLGSAIAVLVGGRDRDGNDVTCDLTYLCLEARMVVKLVYPTVGIAWDEGTPPELTDYACRMLATGVGDPAFFNDELIASGWRDHGVSQADSYNYVNSSCVEVKLAGTSNMWVTAPYVNLPIAALQVMEDLACGASAAPETFEAFNALVKDRVAAQVTRDAEEVDRLWRERQKTGGFPLASCVVNDCLEKGIDFDFGGARYNRVMNSFVGLANLVDGLTAIKKLVYEANELSLSDFSKVLQSDFEGHEDLRRRIVSNLPSYGTDNDEVDGLAVEWAEFLQESTESHIVGLHRYVPGFFCWVMHSVLGEATGATPDGRKAGTALADGAGASQGRETCGPTASILSTTKWSHKKALGGLVQNIKFSESAIATESGREALRSLIETYLRRGGFEIQVNLVGADTLRDAQVHPEDYTDLIVRVAGYSDYFTHLSPSMQAEIIARTEHTAQ